MERKGGGGIGGEGEGEGKFTTPEATKLSGSNNSMGRGNDRTTTSCHLRIEKGLEGKNEG